ncbi:hypothetical protein [Roseateles flavus]|uniref:Uncharacterized protein n=1 Tax=Roseateles flavus TaxID=3149041 RepID=A0ABV0GCD1_9BURK
MQLNRTLVATTLLALMGTPQAWAQDCAGTRTATPADLARGEGVALLNSMGAACRSQQPERFFRLQTSQARASAERAGDKAGLFRNYCEFTDRALKALGGDAAAGVHTIGPHKGRTRCGVPASFWFVHTKDGELALRLEVAVESGQLRMDTH